MFIIFDLDGCLADFGHRVHLWKPNQEDNFQFHQDCVRDKPIVPMIKLYKTLLKANHWVEIWTHRPEDVEIETRTWFSRHQIPSPSRLRMRSIGDRRDEVYIKARWLQECFDMAKENNWAGHVPDMVFDDHQEVISLFQHSGILCCQNTNGSR